MPPHSTTTLIPLFFATLPFPAFSMSAASSPAIYFGRCSQQSIGPPTIILRGPLRGGVGVGGRVASGRRGCDTDADGSMVAGTPTSSGRPRGREGRPLYIPLPSCFLRRLPPPPRRPLVLCVVQHSKSSLQGAPTSQGSHTPLFTLVIVDKRPGKHAQLPYCVAHSYTPSSPSPSQTFKSRRRTCYATRIIQQHAFFGVRVGRGGWRDAGDGPQGQRNSAALHLLLAASQAGEYVRLGSVAHAAPSVRRGLEE